MKGYRFYEELVNKGKRSELPKGTIVAVMLDEDDRPMVFSSSTGWVNYSAVAGVFDEPDSAVCTTSVDAEYLRDCCRRVSEKRAREIHPALFEYLDK